MRLWVENVNLNQTLNPLKGKSLEVVGCIWLVLLAEPCVKTWV